MPDVELQLPEEAKSLGISNIACREGTFLIVYLGKEYSCAFPSAVWGINRDQQATLAYLYDRLTNGDVQLPFKIADFISKTIKLESNWRGGLKIFLTSTA